MENHYPKSNKENEAGEPPLLEVRQLRKFFPIQKGLLSRKVGEVKAVDNVSFKLQEGSDARISRRIRVR